MRIADCGMGVNGVILLSGRQKMRNAKCGLRNGVTGASESRKHGRAIGYGNNHRTD
jgi:hypothetical protein